MLIKNFFQAAAGSRIWKKTVSPDISDKLILLFPDGNTAISYFGLLYADEYAEKVNQNNILIISDSEVIERASKLLVKTPASAVTLSHKEMAAVLRYLSLCIDLMGFSVYDNVIHISERYPYGNSFALMNRSGIFPEDYLVWNRIYNRKSFYYAEEPKTKPPVCKASDHELECFMNFGLKT